MRVMSGLVCSDGRMVPPLAHHGRMIGLVASAVADDRDFVAADIVVQIHERTTDVLVARHAVILHRPLEHRHHLVGLRIGTAHFVGRHVVIGLTENIVPFGAAGRDDIAGEIEVALFARAVVKTHERFEQRARLDMVRTPAQRRDRHFGRLAHLLDDAIGLIGHRPQHGRIGLDQIVIAVQAEQHVLPFPQIAAGPVGLLLGRHATDAAVRPHRAQQVLHGLRENLLELRIGRVAVEHAARTDRLAPHLAQRELAASVAKKVDHGGIGHDALVPVVDRVPDVVLEKSVETHGPGRERTDRIVHFLGKGGNHA